MPDLIPVRSVRTGGVDYIEQPTREESQIAALIRERDGYRRIGRDAQALEVDAELDRLGYVEPTDPKETNDVRDSEPQRKRQRTRRRPTARGE